ncbi:TPA: type VI secretion system tip protein VgrG [Cronobacter sakazakii]|uniref:type VI secretion system Vgr family protein n=2 Tax=Cronobacter sakazakii TaxID=28141 RepID=UPI0004A965F3|nr:type VI secretion system Vgr family protein [Cronobacter sakazakii]EGT5207579.1 type VI secretion system tip protein VgrG [Cronobacter sakazakii]EGT5650106.1 type VI secretion system tip protein VgrG [Cronobacter sakazakii]EGT5747191.1 type VI secretion system tip protein VgrG [Cronobacter sakazakii]EGT5754154.1 type VI secretion system tip protein VgrG [Cronobacter sakazakii]EIZ2182049.1 type VI secretion system tip protein VgrG [Cronobacter sakazakii]
MKHTAIAGNISLSRYLLDINDCPVNPDVLIFRGREALSEPFSWRIEFTTPHTVQREDALMKYARFDMNGLKTIYGVITRFAWLSTNADQSHYAVTLESRLALLSRTRRCAIFQNQSVPEVVEQVLRAHGLEGPDFEFRLSREYPYRDIITQWRETDLEFIQRILAEVGIWFRFAMNDATELDVVVFGDTQLQYEFNIRLPYREPSGLSAEESVWGVRSWHTVVSGRTYLNRYNYRNATSPMQAQVAVRSEAVTTGEHYRYGDIYQEEGDERDPEPATESGAFYARIDHERELNKSVRLHLFSNAPHLEPGQVLEPQGDVITALKNGVLMTLLTYRGARDSRLHVSVWGQPYTERYCFRPDCPPRPEIHGTLPARVESREKHDIYAHLDEYGRYRVRLDVDRNDSEPGFGYVWLRMAKPYTAEDAGWHMPLIDGTEVAIAWRHGDIDQPYIAHALHDSEHADVVNRDNRSQNILRTAGDNELRMEDRRGEEHIALTTPYGASQLNEGQVADAQGKSRGAGFELRTDEYGVIRVAKGLFITAEGQARAAGEVLDMETALKEITLCLQQIEELSRVAEQAQALQADIASQTAMFNERLRPLNQMIHAHGPQGVAFTSGEHMQLAAAKNVAINAGGDISVGVMGNMTALAGDKLGLFAHTGPLSLKSGEGPIGMQTQNGRMSLAAQKRLTMTSTCDVSFAGKKRITLIGGGSYLKIEQGKIEYGTTGVYLRRVPRTYVGAAAAMAVDLPSYNSVEEMPAALNVFLFS